MQEEVKKVEEWRQAESHGVLFEVSNYGNIRTVDRHRTTKRGKQVLVKGHAIKQKINRHGYPYINIKVKKTTKSIRTHRLVAMAFIPNIEDKPQVNHIDFDRTNNNVENLEWCTAKENMRHSKHRLYNPVTGKFGSNHPLSKSVDVFEVYVKKIKTFGSAIEAAAAMNVTQTAVHSGCIYKQKKINGLVFRFKDEIELKDGEFLLWSK